METSVTLDLMFNMESKIVIFEGNQEQGIFSKARKFYSETTTDEEIKKQIKNARIKLGQKYKFNGLKMFQVIQKMEDNEDYPDNKYVLIDEKHLKKEDYFEEEIKADREQARYDEVTGEAYEKVDNLINQKKATAIFAAAVSAFMLYRASSPCSPRATVLITGINPWSSKERTISGFTSVTSPTKPKSAPSLSIFFARRRPESTPLKPTAFPPC